MRIVAGSLRGKAIQAPDGRDTRPTTDRVREALFSSLYSLRGGFEDAVVLDAFAGSGALGIEALSRGASQAVFYERDAKAAATLARNLEACKLGPSAARVVKRDVMHGAVSRADVPYDLVFLDPPYAFDADEVLSMVSALVGDGIVAGDAIVVYEHAHADGQRVAMAASDRRFAVVSAKKYGKTGVTVLSPERP